MVRGARDADNLIERGRIRNMRGDYDPAIADFTEALGIAPGNARAFSLRGWAWSRKHEHEKAVADLDRAIELDPRLARAFSNRASVWIERKEYDKAISDLSEAIRLDPRSVELYTQRAWTWGEKGEYAEVIADCSEVIRRDPTNSWAYAGRGRAWHASGRYDRAQADYDEAVRRNPREIEAHGGRAWLRATYPDERFRDGKLAVESATRACELDGWKDASYLEILAAAYAESGDFAAAVRWQTTALERTAEDASKAECAARLELYQAQKPYRQTI